MFSPTTTTNNNNKINFNPLDLGEGKHLISLHTLHRIKAEPHRSSSNLLCVPGPEVENLGLDWRLPEAAFSFFAKIEDKRNIINMNEFFRHKLLR